LAELTVDLNVSKWMARDQSYSRAITALASIEGPAACAHPGFCYRAGKRMRIDASTMPPKMFLPPRGLALLQARIDRQEFAALEIVDPAQLDLSGYRVIRPSDGIADSVIYAPKPKPSR